MTLFNIQLFHPAANSAALVKPFYTLNPPLFQDYTREIRQVWKGYIGKAKNGARFDETWGKPSVTLIIGKVTRAELAYAVTLQGACTIYCRNEDTNTFHFYSAKLDRVTAGSFEKSGDMYNSLTLDFIDLIQL